jgi:biopolymer transport protein ExbD
MAEISQSDGGGKGGKKRSKKASTKVDMTPMVDLAFLLITFFMLATTLQKQQIMSLVMPPKLDKPMVDPPELKASKALTILLGEENKVFWYVLEQDGSINFNETDFSNEGIRKVILDRKLVAGNELNVIIKPMKTSKYQNVVDLLDELAITGVKKYIIDAISNDEIAMVMKEETL